MEEPKTKCPRCRCWRSNEEFSKKNKVLRTCVKCRENSKKDREPKTEEPKNNEEPNKTKEPNDPTCYIRHQKVFKKINKEFLQQKAKQVHIINMKYVFVDIRDHRIFSDKDFTYTN